MRLLPLATEEEIRRRSPDVGKMEDFGDTDMNRQRLGSARKNASSLGTVIIEGERGLKRERSKSILHTSQLRASAM